MLKSHRIGWLEGIELGAWLWAQHPLFLLGPHGPGPSFHPLGSHLLVYCLLLVGLKGESPILRVPHPGHHQVGQSCPRATMCVDGMEVAAPRQSHGEPHSLLSAGEQLHRTPGSPEPSLGDAQGRDPPLGARV